MSGGAYFVKNNQMQKNDLSTYFGLDHIKGVQNLLETGVVTTNLKGKNTHNVDYMSTSKKVLKIEVTLW